jgi:transposase
MTSKEGRMVMAIEAYNKREGLSIRAAAKIFDVSYATMTRRLRGCKARGENPPKTKKLTESEEKVLLKFILDLDACAFPPRLSGVGIWLTFYCVVEGLSLSGRNGPRTL